MQTHDELQDEIEEILDSYEACLIRMGKSVAAEEFELAEQHKQDSRYIKDMIRRRPQIEKLEFILKLENRKERGEEEKSYNAVTGFKNYINMFWKELI